MTVSNASTRRVVSLLMVTLDLDLVIGAQEFRESAKCGVFSILTGVLGPSIRREVFMNIGCLILVTN